VYKAQGSPGIMNSGMWRVLCGSDGVASGG
jgi:hypothetical protein